MSISRQPQGIPVGGQFAATTHAESAVSLASGRPAELDGWPEALYPPKVTFLVSPEGKIITEATDISGDFIQVWDKNDGSGGHDGHALGIWEGASDEDIEQAQNWLTQRHKVIVAAAREEVESAIERSRPRILAKATGQRTEASTAELSAFHNRSLAAAKQADEDLELSSVALSARAILEQHPTAATADLQTGSWDNGDFVSGAVIRDAEGNRLYEYVETDGATDEEERDNYVVDTLRTLDANAEQSHWAGAFSTGSYGDELYTIDLRKAVAWVPGDEA
jgi:hypothetical protein